MERIRPGDDRDPREIAAEKQAFFEAIQKAQAEGTALPEPPPSLRGRRVLLDDNMTLPSVFGRSFDVTDRGLHVEVECEVVNGKPACVAMRLWALDGSPLRPTDLEGHPLDEYANQAADGNYWRMPPGSPIAIHGAERDPTARFTPADDQSFKRRHRATDIELRQVAAVYRAALERGDPPTRAVRVQFEVSRATAGRLIRGARDREFLGPAINRKAGEADKEEKA
jgi:hypothetical protein